MTFYQKFISIFRFLLLPILVISAIPLFELTRPGTPYTIFGKSYENSWLILFYGVLLVFGIVPLLDIIFPKHTYNPKKEEESTLFSFKIFDLMVWVILPIQLIAMGLYFTYMYRYADQAPLLTLIGWTATLGLTCGILGINVGHELGHRRTSWQRYIGKALLWTSLRMAFYIEHNWGHHANVSTPEDPASAKKGELLWTFAPKSIFLTWINAWRIQMDLLKKRNKSFFSFYNDMLWYVFFQWGFIFLLWATLGWKTALGFVIAAFLGMLLLESVNYIEHYGLRREKDKNGKYERTLPIHSWNSDHSFSGAALYNLSRHSDHHFIASRPYQILRNYESCPNMPTGYAGMIVLAWMPPLWFAVMNPRVDKVRAIDKKAYKSELSLA